MQELNQEFEIDIKELIALLLKKIWTAVIAAVLCGVIATVYATNFITPMYNSKARLYIISSQHSGTFSPSELSVYENLARDYISLVKSRTILEAVIESNDLKMSAGRLASCVSVSSPTGTRIIDISVVYSDPVMAKQICDSLCSEVQRKVIERMKTEQITVWDWGSLPSSPTSPNISEYTVFGSIIGFCLPLVTFVLLYVFDDSLITTENVETRLGVNVIGTVPYSRSLVGRRTRSELSSKSTKKQ